MLLTTQMLIGRLTSPLMLIDIVLNIFFVCLVFISFGWTRTYRPNVPVLVLPRCFSSFLQRISYCLYVFLICAVKID